MATVVTQDASRVALKTVTSTSLVRCVHATDASCAASLYKSFGAASSEVYFPGAGRFQCETVLMARRVFVK